MDRKFKKVVLSRRNILLALVGFLALVGGAGGCAVPVPGVNSDICTSDIIQGWDRSSYQEFLQVFGNRIQGYRNSKKMAVNGMVERLCKEENVGYVDLWESFVRKEDMYARDGLHLSGKGAAVFAEGLSGALPSGLGKVRYLYLWAGSLSKKAKKRTRR